MSFTRAPAALHHCSVAPVCGDPHSGTQTAGAEHRTAEAALHHLRWVRAAHDLTLQRNMGIFSLTEELFYISYVYMHPNKPLVIRLMAQSE